VTTNIVMRMNVKEVTRQFKLTRAPSQIKLDPNNTILKDARVIASP